MTKPTNELPEMKIAPGESEYERYVRWGAECFAAGERAMAQVIVDLGTYAMDTMEVVPIEARQIALAALTAQAEKGEAGQDDGSVERSRTFVRALLSSGTLKHMPQAVRHLERLVAAPSAQPSHPDDEAVDRFAAAMKAKLKHAREVKGRGGWQDCDHPDLNRMLHAHVAKGDPTDVANFCMFLFDKGWGIAQPSQSTGEAMLRGTLTAIALNLDPPRTGDEMREMARKALAAPVAQAKQIGDKGPPSDDTWVACLREAALHQDWPESEAAYWLGRGITATDPRGPEPVAQAQAREPVAWLVEWNHPTQQRSMSASKYVLMPDDEFPNPDYWKFTPLGPIAAPPAQPQEGK